MRRVRILYDDMSGPVWIGDYEPPILHYSQLGAAWVGQRQTALLAYIQRHVSRDGEQSNELLVPPNYYKVTRPLTEKEVVHGA